MHHLPATRLAGRLLAFAAAGVLIGCQAGSATKQDGIASQPDAFSRPAQLPAPADLPRTASSPTVKLGSQFFLQSGGTILSDALVLSDHPPTHKDAADVLKSPSQEQYSFAFALYLFGGLSELPVAFSVATDTNYKRRYWLGLANWSTGVWDFLPTQYTASATLALDTILDGTGDYMSDEGAMAFVVVLDDQPEDLTIDEVSLISPKDPFQFTASQHQWDGVKLTWHMDSSAAGYLLSRRTAGLEWTLLTADPLPAASSSYTDTSAPDGIEIEYRLQQGLWLNLMGAPRTFWSPGALTTGRRPPVQVELGDTSIMNYWPVNIYNLLGFFYETETQVNGVELIHNLCYPPESGWKPFTPGEDQPEFEPEPAEGWPTPFALFQSSIANNTELLVAYSDATGCQTQVATIGLDGALTWEAPVLARDPGSIVLGMTPLPMRVGLITWSTVDNRMELVDSEDIYGRSWFAFEPAVYKYQIITPRRPDGPLEIRTVSSVPNLCFCEAETGLPVVLRDSGSQGWMDDSPDFIVCAPGPRYLNYAMSPAVPVTGLLYLEPDRRNLRLLKRIGTNDWTKASLSTWASVEDGHEITEFDYIALGGEVSTSNILLYIADGNLYFRYSVTQSMSNWGTPILLDDTGSCRDLRIIPIGSDDNYSSYVFATYLSTDGDGITQINFRELKAIIGAPYS